MTSPTNGKIWFDFEAMRWRGISLEQYEIWEKLYPDVNLKRVLSLDMVQWLDRKVLSRHPLKVSVIARKKNWKSTICNWLKKEQVKAVGL